MYAAYNVVAEGYYTGDLDEHGNFSFTNKWAEAARFQSLEGFLSWRNHHWPKGNPNVTLVVAETPLRGRLTRRWPPGADEAGQG